MQRPPDANHPWRYDETRREWFYIVNGNQRVYHNSTPRSAPPPNVTPTGRQYQPDDVTVNYKLAGPPSHRAGGSRPIPIRPGPAAQPGTGQSFTSPSFAVSPQPVPHTGFSLPSQSPGTGRFQGQRPPGGSSVAGASPSANSRPTGPGRAGIFCPPVNAHRTGPAHGGGYVPPTSGGRGAGGSGRGGGYRPPTGGGRGGEGPGQGGGYQPPSNALPARGGGGETSQTPKYPLPSSSRVTGDQKQELDADYQLRKRPRKFFRLGKVFKMVHTETLGSQADAKKVPSTINTANNDVFAVAYGQKVISKVRRFIVVSEQLHSCNALGRGASKKNASEHGIVYTGSEPPLPFRNEGVMLKTAIRIDPFRRFDVLSSASRVDYAKTYTIEHNVRVKPYGMVNNQFMHHLVKQWIGVIISSMYNPARNAFRAANPTTLGVLGFTREMMSAVLAMMRRSKGPSADARTAIMSVARNSAITELADELEEDASEAEKRTNMIEAEKLAGQVVELILTGMTYLQAVGHVRQLAENGDGWANENAAIGDVDEDDEEDEQEEVDDGDVSPSESESEPEEDDD